METMQRETIATITKQTTEAMQKETIPIIKKEMIVTITGAIKKVADTAINEVERLASGKAAFTDKESTLSGIKFVGELAKGPLHDIAKAITPVIEKSAPEFVQLWKRLVDGDAAIGAFTEKAGTWLTTDGPPWPVQVKGKARDVITGV